MKTKFKWDRHEVLYHPGLFLQAPDALSRLLLPSDRYDCEPMDDDTPRLDSSPSSLEQFLKQKKVLSPFFWILRLRQLICLHGLTLPAKPLLMTTWTIILRKWLDNQRQQAPSSRWLGCSTNYVEVVGRTKICQFCQLVPITNVRDSSSDLYEDGNKLLRCWHLSIPVLLQIILHIFSQVEYVP